MSADELWVEVYQGEVLGEALFGLLTEREQDPARRRQLETLVVLERSTKELAEDDSEREVAETYVAHERALASFARRVLGQEPGEPLEPILSLPHVAAAVV